MMAKVLLIVYIISIVSGSHLYGIIGEAYHAPQPYKFGYAVRDKDSTQHRHEEGDGHGNVRGSYGYTDDKGQYREVHYVADKGGFRAQVKTNEAGTANQNPAHVEVHANPPQHHHDHHSHHHHVPHHHHEVKNHHHHVPHVHHQAQHVHVPHHHEVKVHHHVPSHHHHNYGFDYIAPLHGYSYNPSAFHGYGHWPFPGTNTYGKHHDDGSWKNHDDGSWKNHDDGSWKNHDDGSWKGRDGYSYNSLHHAGPSTHGHDGFRGLRSDYDGGKHAYEKIMEKIKAYRNHKPLNYLGDFKDGSNDPFAKKFENLKYGLGSFDF